MIATDPHPDFYPVTREVCWQPLEEVCPPERLHEFAFAQGTASGWFFYGHARGEVLVHSDGTLYDPAGLLFDGGDA